MDRAATAPLLMPGRNFIGRRHRDRKEILIHLSQLVDCATEPPVFCEGLVVLGVELLVGHERPERDQLTDLAHLQEDRFGAHKILILRLRLPNPRNSCSSNAEARPIEWHKRVTQL